MDDRQKDGWTVKLKAICPLIFFKVWGIIKISNITSTNKEQDKNKLARKSVIEQEIVLVKHCVPNYVHFSYMLKISKGCKCDKMLSKLIQIYSLAQIRPNICLFDLILYVPSTIFQLCRAKSSWVEPVLS